MIPPAGTTFLFRQFLCGDPAYLYYKYYYTTYYDLYNTPMVS